jgi:hypothetical protein
MSATKKLVLALLLGVLVLAAVAGASAALAASLIGPWLDDAVLQGFTVTVNGEQWQVPDLTQLDTWQVALGVALAVLLTLLVVPLALLIALGGSLLGLLAGALGLMLALTLALSPLLLLLALVWWLLRPRAPQPEAPQKSRSEPPV